MAGKLRWTGAWLLAIVGGVLYLVVDGWWVYAVGFAALLPLMWMASERGGTDVPWGSGP